MYWLWIPVAALLVLFVLVLCCNFFSDYSCCPCRRQKTPHYILPITDLPPCATPSAPVEPPVLLSLYPGAKNVNEAICQEDGLVTLDLHGMTVKESKEMTIKFLQTYLRTGKTMRIITGHGMHSRDSVPVIKPIIMAMLRSRNVPFQEIHRGGCLKILN